jgi:dihydrofolate reductase
MGRLVYLMNTSLDGYIARPDGEIAAPAPDPELHRFHNDRLREKEAYLCGRRLYEVMSYWDTFDDDDPSAPEHARGELADVAREFAGIWKALPKIVFSTTLRTVGPNARLATGGVEEVAALKRETEGDLAIGGAGLAAACRELIDEFNPVVHPLVVGGGTAFFAPGTELSLRLLDTRAISRGVVSMRYARY